LQRGDRVVIGEAAERALAEEVGARVTDVCHERVLADDRRGTQGGRDAPRLELVGCLHHRDVGLREERFEVAADRQPARGVGVVRDVGVLRR